MPFLVSLVKSKKNTVAIRRYRPAFISSWRWDSTLWSWVETRM